VSTVCSRAHPTSQVLLRASSGSAHASNLLRTHLWALAALLMDPQAHPCTPLSCHQLFSSKVVSMITTMPSCSMTTRGTSQGISCSLLQDQALPLPVCLQAAQVEQVRHVSLACTVWPAVKGMALCMLQPA